MNCSRSSASRVVRCVVRTVAVRGTSRSRAISPKHSPRPLVAAEDAVFEDLDLALLDQVEAVARVALGDHLLARRRSHRDEVVADPLQGRNRQRREDRVAAQELELLLGDRGADLEGPQPGPAQTITNSGRSAASASRAPRMPSSSEKTEALIEPSCHRRQARRLDRADDPAQGLVGAEPLEQGFGGDLDDRVAEADRQPAHVGGDGHRPERREQRSPGRRRKLPPPGRSRAGRGRAAWRGLAPPSSAPIPQAALRKPTLPCSR